MTEANPKEQRSYASAQYSLVGSLIESGWVPIKKTLAMLMKYKDYCKHMHKSKAIKISRHLLARIKYVLKKRLSKRPAEWVRSRLGFGNPIECAAGFAEPIGFNCI